MGVMLPRTVYLSILVSPVEIVEDFDARAVFTRIQVWERILRLQPSAVR